MRRPRLRPGPSTCPAGVRVCSSGVVGAKLVRTIGVPAVDAQGGAGLTRIAVDVRLRPNRFVYVCTSRDTASGWRNQVLCYSVRAERDWVGVRVLNGSMIANTIHDGCALEMDRLGKLWVRMGMRTTGPGPSATVQVQPVYRRQ